MESSRPGSGPELLHMLALNPLDHLYPQNGAGRPGRALLRGTCSGISGPRSSGPPSFPPLNLRTRCDCQCRALQRRCGAGHGHFSDEEPRPTQSCVFPRSHSGGARA